MDLYITVKLSVIMSSALYINERNDVSPPSFLTQGTTFTYIKSQDDLKNVDGNTKRKLAILDTLNLFFNPNVNEENVYYFREKMDINDATVYIKDDLTEEIKSNLQKGGFYTTNNEITEGYQSYNLKNKTDQEQSPEAWVDYSARLNLIKLKKFTTENDNFLGSLSERLKNYSNDINKKQDVLQNLKERAGDINTLNNEKIKKSITKKTKELKNQYTKLQNLTKTQETSLKDINDELEKTKNLLMDVETEKNAIEEQLEGVTRNAEQNQFRSIYQELDLAMDKSLEFQKEAIYNYDQSLYDQENFYNTTENAIQNITITDVGTLTLMGTTGLNLNEKNKTIGYSLEFTISDELSFLNGKKRPFFAYNDELEIKFKFFKRNRSNQLFSRCPFVILKQARYLKSRKVMLQLILTMKILQAK